MNGMATSMIYKYIILQVASVEIIKDGRYSVPYGTKNIFYTKLASTSSSKNNNEKPLCCRDDDFVRWFTMKRMCN